MMDFLVPAHVLPTPFEMGGAVFFLSLPLEARSTDGPWVLVNEADHIEVICERGVANQDVPANVLFFLLRFLCFAVPSHLQSK